MAKLKPSRAVALVLSAPLLALRTQSLRKNLVKLALGYAVLFVVIMVVLVFLGLSVADWLVDFSQVATWIRWLSKIAIVLGLLLLSPVVFVLSSGLFLAFWEERLFLLARKVGGAEPPSAQSVGVVSEVTIPVRRFAHALVPSAAAFMLNGIPIIGSVIYLGLQAVIVSFAVGWDLLDYHFDSHGYSWNQRRVFLRNNRRLVFSIGAAATGLLLIPGLQPGFAVSHVVAAGLISAELDKGVKNQD